MEAIAKVVTELRSGKYQRLVSPPPLAAVFDRILQPALGTVVDATAIYLQKAEPQPYNFYDDHPSCAPPWMQAAICYENKHGNVFVMAVSAIERPKGERDVVWEPDPEDNKEIDWPSVRWVMEVPVYLGGRSAQGPGPTGGPAHLWRLAVYETGTLADVRWVELSKDYPHTMWDLPILVLLGTFNFMGCRNVELVPASMARSERRRVERIDPGFEARVLAVRPTGRRSQGSTAPSEGLVAMTSVVGHPAHYGDCCPGVHEPRGRLFGKLEGRFWIPQHARGNPEFGIRQNDYRIEP